MSRRELREQIFKLLFRVEFNHKDDMPEQIALFFQQEDEHEMGPAESKCQEDFMSLCIAFNAVHFHDVHIRVLFDPFLKIFVVMADTVSTVLCTGPGRLSALFVFNFPPQVNVPDIEYAGINVGISRSF